MPRLAPQPVQIYRGTTAQNDAYTGAVGEATFDSTKRRLRIHDGATQGGFEISLQADIDAFISNAHAYIANRLVTASTSVRGVVQLSNLTTGTSQTLAATSKAVSDALQAAKDYVDTLPAPTGYTVSTPLTLSSSGVLGIDSASTSAAGVVQLSSSTSSSSTTLAATSSAVKAAYDLANAKSGTPSNGSTSTAGIVQLSDSDTSTSTSLAATANAARKVYADANALASGTTYTFSAPFQTHTTSTKPGKYIGVRVATTSQTGVVKLSSSLTSTSTTLAANAYASNQLHSALSAKMIRPSGDDTTTILGTFRTLINTFPPQNTAGTMSSKLPSGGTWAYFSVGVYSGKTSGGQFYPLTWDVAGVAAGGTTLGTYSDAYNSSTEENIQIYGFCWRVA